MCEGNEEGESIKGKSEVLGLWRNRPYNWRRCPREKREGGLVRNEAEGLFNCVSGTVGF